MAVQVEAPLPGVFYRRPDPDSPPFFSEGDAVKAGDTVGLIEVMKQYFEVKAAQDGTVSRFLVEDASPVEPGQPLVDLD